MGDKEEADSQTAKIIGKKIILPFYCTLNSCVLLLCFPKSKPLPLFSTVSNWLVVQMAAFWWYSWDIAKQIQSRDQTNLYLPRYLHNIHLSSQAFSIPVHFRGLPEVLLLDGCTTEVHLSSFRTMWRIQAWTFHKTAHEQFPHGQRIPMSFTGFWLERSFREYVADCFSIPLPWKLPQQGSQLLEGLRGRAEGMDTSSHHRKDLLPLQFEGKTDLYKVQCTGGIIQFQSTFQRPRRVNPLW